MPRRPPISGKVDLESVSGVIEEVVEVRSRFEVAMLSCGPKSSRRACGQSRTRRTAGKDTAAHQQ
jgi:hypothetical protein